VEASTEANTLLKPETAQKRGKALLNLKCTDAQSGLLGKTLLVLEPNRGDLFPPHKFTPHDVVALKLNKADGTSPALGQGVVYRVKDSAITVAFEDVPEDGLDSPLRIEKLTNEVRMGDGISGRKRVWVLRGLLGSVLVGCEQICRKPARLKNFRRMGSYSPARIEKLTDEGRSEDYDGVSNRFRASKVEL
jgi:hypothetical protein